MAIANGKLKSVFSLKIGGTDYVTDVISFDVSSEESDGDSQTFAEYNTGSARDWTLTVTAVWDGGSVGSLHDYLWNNAGTTAAFDIQPLGGTVTTARPRYTGSVRIPNRPDFSAEAGNNATFEYAFEIIGTPNKITAGTP